MAEYRYLAEPDPQWTNFPKNLPEGTKTYGMNRAHDAILGQPGLCIDELDVPIRNGDTICVRRYRKSTPTTQSPGLFLYMHGGGYVTGGLETDDATCRAIAAQVDVVIVSVEYRLAPEHKFPFGFEDTFDVVRWAASTQGQQQLDVDLSRAFILGGTSAGANFTCGISHLAVQEGLCPKITGVVFLAGSYCHPDARPAKYRARILSVDEVRDAPGLTRKSINYFSAKYGAPPLDKRLSPLLFDSHKDIARKAYFAICGWDPRRDESLLLEQLLKQDGVQTKMDVYPGLPHGFWTTCPDLPVSKDWLSRLIVAMKWMIQ